MSQGDKNTDQKLSRDELTALADAWFDKMDPGKAGRIAQQDFAQRIALVIPPPPPAPLGPTGFPVQGRATQLGPDTQIGTWPEFNKMIGGFFKFHWNDGQVITVKIDEPNHPLNAPFKGQSNFQVIDETYTFGRDTYSRENLRVLTSVDYAKMSAEDKAKEQYPRSRRRLRAELDPPRGQGPRVLRGARPQREGLRDEAAPRARPAGHPVRARRSAGRRQPERQGWNEVEPPLSPAWRWRLPGQA